MLFELRIRSNPERLRIVRSAVEQGALLAGCSESEAGEIVIAVNEACMNIMQHAYAGDTSKSIALALRLTDDLLVCRIEDEAPLVDLASIRPRELGDIRPGGLGTHFMAELMDECIYGHLDGDAGNYLEMRKTVSGAAENLRK